MRGPFLNLATARVSTSAEEARDLGYLRQGDSVSMARETLIADAKALALGLARAGYRPPPPRRIRVIGETGAGDAAAGAASTSQGAHQISEHDAKVSGHLARVLSGGAVPAGAAVSEQHILDLEREAFLSLCGEPKTRERIQYMLAEEQASAELRSTKPMRDVAILSAVRTPIGRAPRGVFKNTRPDDLGRARRPRGDPPRRGRPGRRSRTSSSAAPTPRPSRG